jgi:hypothetical protein
MSDTDSDGNRLLNSGTWNGGTTLSVQGGQAMHFQLNNLNVLGTTINISADRTGKTKGLILVPSVSGDITFSVFGKEPMGWTFTVSTDSDAFLVGWQLFSTWIPGDPPNG